MYIKDAFGRDLSIVTFTTTGLLTQQRREYFVYGTDRIARVLKIGSATEIEPDEATYFLTDHLGNTRVAFMVDSMSVPLIVNAMDYYSYGKILREYHNGDGDRYLTTQHERDKETGLDYRGARYYDSDVARFLSLDPLAAKYPMLSPYNYVGAMPIIAIDPDGKKIVFPADATEEFKARFNEAREYLKAHGADNLIQQMDDLDAIFTISETKGLGVFTASNTTIYWDPYAGAETAEGHILSPTVVLNHEADHALQEILHPEQKKADRATKDPEYTNLEEKRVITGSEQITALKLGEIKEGEVTRRGHTTEGSVQTSGPTSNIDVNEVTIIAPSPLIQPLPKKGIESIYTTPTKLN